MVVSRRRYGDPISREERRKIQERVEKRKAEAKARILALQDRPKIEAEIERWVSAHVREYLGAGQILKEIDSYISDIAEDGIQEAWMREVGYQELEDWDGVVRPSPLWAEIVFYLDEAGYTDEEAEREMRRLRELFKHVMEKMGLLEEERKGE